MELELGPEHGVGAFLAAGGAGWWIKNWINSVKDRLNKAEDRQRAIETEIATLKAEPQDSEKVTRLEVEVEALQKWQGTHKEEDRQDHEDLKAAINEVKADVKALTKDSAEIKAKLEHLTNGK